MSVRKYTLRSCPKHGQEAMSHGVCRAEIDRRKTGQITYCHEEEIVTAVDERDVQSLLDAVGDVARRTIDDASRAELELALKSFSTQSEEKQR